MARSGCSARSLPRFEAFGALLGALAGSLWQPWGLLGIDFAAHGQCFRRFRCIGPVFRQVRPGCLDLVSMCSPGCLGCLILAALNTPGHTGLLDLGALVAPGGPGWLDLAGLVALGHPGWLDLADQVSSACSDWLDLAANESPNE